ncbi:hypothetical protein HJC23_004530 [Cyclotella cryptica]|uniref:STAS domain-containing protein n=1 Tax=Cyclotella cryptica TaxID=29204 RepID=A0ABD3QA67_9STRA|eukprot:CCRYP_007268-RA/>CCRYP_007268-RA protein AED:0.02 eAED:0.02 QI:151/1/1/1/1/1/4/761/1047
MSAENEMTIVDYLEPAVGSEGMSPDAMEKKYSSPGDSVSPRGAQSSANSNRPRPAAIKAHNRAVTPHTASLMSLFSRPTSPPKTPVTPNYFYGSEAAVDGPKATGIPCMPYPQNLDADDEDDFERMPLTAQASKIIANVSNKPHVYSSGSGSFTSIDCSFKDTLRVQNRWHNPDNETILVGNLTSKEQDAIADVLACRDYNENDALTATPTRANRCRLEATTNNSLLHIFKDPKIAPVDYSTFPLTPRNENSRLPCLRAISELAEKDDVSTMSFPASHVSKHTRPINCRTLWRKCTDYVLDNLCDTHQIKTTLIGAVLYSLYALVFCFAEASAITRPSHPNSEDSGLLAPMALMGCVGTLVTAPMMTLVLGLDYPASYPSLDMFLAPFLAQMAADVDEVLVQIRDGSESEHAVQNDMEVFLATFVALNAFGMALSGALCILASRVKLANLAGFLPYPVLCGFFSSVGISVWMSAFKVDTGIAFQNVIASKNVQYIFADFFRHIPSLFGGVALYFLGPRKISYLIGIISATIVIAYFLLFITGMTIEDAQEVGFFWKASEVMMTKRPESAQNKWGPPAPFGLWCPSVLKRICWPAFLNGLNNAIAMSVIYLLRCSLHAAALKKNLANIKEVIAKEQPRLNNSETSNNSLVFKRGQDSICNRPPMSVLHVLTWYAYGLTSLVFTGGFAVLPALSLGGIFAKVGAHTRTPQFAAMFILMGFYISDFRLVSFVPKFTFSSLLVMAAIDLVNTWFIKSYKKTAQIYEWLVIPFIVAASLLSGMLQAVGMGVAISTFIFVAQFYRSGVVKFIATGLTIRSSVERSCEDSKWLDQNGDLIQILVVQNYLYFGNATSCLNYITTMFTDDDNESCEADIDLPPIPKNVILDLSIVTGIDTSAVDVMAEISTLCKVNQCCLILSGIPPTVKPPLIAGGLTPSRQNPHLFFMDDLDVSLGKAEDDLLKLVARNEERLIQDGRNQKHQRITSMIDNGLRYALRKIDEEHDVSFATNLSELENYAIARELDAGELLNEVGSDCLPRGLYFIESGLIKCGK